MDEKEFVQFQTARKLKAAGYSYPIHGVRLFKSAQLVSDNAKRRIPCAPLIPLWQAQKWLREKHNIHIQIEVVIGKRWTYTLVDMSTKTDMYGDIQDRILERDSYPVIDTYEAALSAGIDAALELINN